MIIEHDDCSNEKIEDNANIQGSNIREKLSLINQELKSIRDCPARSFVDQYSPGYYSIGMQYRCKKKKGKLVYERCEGCGSR